MPRMNAKSAIAPAELLARHPELQRLCRIMTAWWRGDPMSAIAADHGISRQRVHALLTKVACTERLRQNARNAPADMPRCAARHHVEGALRQLLHPMAWRLTPRQRCALAWRVQGLTTVNAAHRMGTSGQGVRYFLIRAKERLARLSARPATQAAKSSVPPPPVEAAAFDLPEFGRAEVEAILAAAPGRTEGPADAKA